MSSSIASSLIRRTLRIPFSSSKFFHHHRQQLFYSSRASSPSFSLTRGAVTQIPANLSSLLPIRSVSSKVGRADENLKRVLESEIVCAQNDLAETTQVKLLPDFPFEVIDNTGDQAVILKREFSGESIQVTVMMNLDGEPDSVDEDGDDKDESGDDIKESSVQPTISLVVNIDKGDGPILEFCCDLNPDELKIESMAMKNREDPDDGLAYQGPEFSDLDESLQKALHKYLETRGIKSSLFDFLQEYMMKKDNKEYLAWLNNMKDFISSDA